MFAPLRIAVEWGHGSILLSHLAATIAASHRANLGANATILFASANMRFNKCGLESHVRARRWSVGLKEAFVRIDPKAHIDEGGRIASVGALDGSWRLCDIGKHAAKYADANRVHWRLFLTPGEIAKALKAAVPPRDAILAGPQGKWTDKDRRRFQAHCGSFIRNLPRRLLMSRHEGAFYPAAHVLALAAAVDALNQTKSGPWLDLALEFLPADELYLQSFALMLNLLPKDRLDRRPVCAIKNKGEGPVSGLAEGDCMTDRQRGTFAFKRVYDATGAMKRPGDVPLLRQLSARMQEHPCNTQRRPPSLCGRGNAPANGRSSGPGRPSSGPGRPTSTRPGRPAARRPGQHARP
ncbi:hypothetical protein M885DRAFT_552872 [Pelagophyceae sp. CCMP2097]|nr:hypothetical protein M885DRAFT_552872 [Pelagophyceae sp. CCMP2097]